MQNGGHENVRHFFIPDPSLEIRLVRLELENEGRNNVFKP